MMEQAETRERSPAYAKYRAIDQKIFMTMDESEALSRDLADEILAFEGKPDLVVGLANGALLPTWVVADRLGVPFEIIRLRRQSSRHKQRLMAIKNALRIPAGVATFGPLMAVWRWYQERYSKLESPADAFTLPVAGKHVVVVDDAIHTGASVRHAQQQLLDRGAAKVRIAVLCWYEGEGDSGDWGPDLWLHRKDQYYPWSNNSPYLEEFMAWLPRHGLTFWQ